MSDEAQAVRLFVVSQEVPMAMWLFDLCVMDHQVTDGLLRNTSD
jgi:hypothetical protein